MEFSLSPEQEIKRSDAATFAREKIDPYVAELEEKRQRRSALFAEMAEEGYFSMMSDSQDTIAYLLVIREIAKADAGIALAIAVTNMVAEAVAQHGSRKLCSRYLSRLTSPDGVPAAFALTEENAGSDAKNIRTTAIRSPSGDRYLLNGRKQLISNGDIAAFAIVIAKSAEGEISAFLVDRDVDGYSVAAERKKMGLLTANLVDIELKNCPAQLLGKRGEGLTIALSALDSGRLAVAAQSLGIAEAAFMAALDYANSREQFGEPIGNQQAVAFKLADMQVSLTAGELMLYSAAWQRDRGISYSRQAAEAKLFCSEAASRITDEAMQIFGGYGYTKEFPLERYFRDARVARIYEGTSEIQRLVIARRVLGERAIPTI